MHHRRRLCLITALESPCYPGINGASATTPLHRSGHRLMVGSSSSVVAAALRRYVLRSRARLHRTGALLHLALFANPRHQPAAMPCAARER